MSPLKWLLGDNKRQAFTRLHIFVVPFSASAIKESDRTVAFKLQSCQSNGNRCAMPSNAVSQAWWHRAVIAVLKMRNKQPLKSHKE